MRLRQLKIRVQTTDGPYDATLDFPDGLVVVWADNTMGKSTCAKAIVVALGLEAMLTTSHVELPLPHAVQFRLESERGQHDVLESEVFLEIENIRQERVVVQRTIKGTRDKNLVTVHDGPLLTSPGSSAKSRDYFVGRPGAASREAGFHAYLANFLGWTLPRVQTFDGAEYPLYLECLFPYFVVEQTRGWSTVPPPLPNHFRIRDAHKRAIEFLLELDAHAIALRRQALQLERSRLSSEWSARVSRIEDLAERAVGQVQALPMTPIVSWPPTVQPSLMVSNGDNWIAIEQRVNQKRGELAQLVNEEIPRVQDIAQSAQIELAQKEDMVRDQETVLARLVDSYEAETQEVARVEERIRAIDEDIQRNKDVRTLRMLGSRQKSMVDQESCPVCHQAISDSLLPLEVGQTVMSLDESIQFLTEQRRTYVVVHTNSRRAAEARGLQIESLRNALSSTRDEVRELRKTLVSDGRLPSRAAIHARLKLEGEIERDEETLQQFSRALQGFEDLSDHWKRLEQESSRLPREDVTEKDRQKISKWAQILRDQLHKYGFLSFPVDQVSISADTYRPEHEGFDMQASLPLQTTISASDLVRTIWAYLHGLLELSRSLKTNHPGFMIFDEPRQQSTRDLSFIELLKRAATAGSHKQQVIFFTSEAYDRLSAQLTGLDHKLIKIEGRALKRTQTR